MENQSHANSHPDSRNPSPHSQEGDHENPSTDDPLSTISNSHKVKFMCSYGGNIQFRSHDNQLAYVGGETKIITVDRNIKFTAVMTKLSSLCSADVFVKYQLPGEDLDALISVTNDEDLEHMMVEYDLSQRASLAKPARLRLFLFPPKLPAPKSCESNDLKPEQQWFVDALNSVHIPHVKGSSSSAPANQDFLSGFDYRYSVVSATKLPDAVTNVEVNCSPTGTDGGPEDLQVAAVEPAGSPIEIQIQVEESQRLHLEKTEKTLLKGNEDSVKVNKTMDHYSQKNNPGQKDTPSVHIVQSPVSIPGSASVYSPEKLMKSASYSLAASATVTEPPFYLIAAPAVMYHAPNLRTVNGTTVGQPYYRVPRMVQTSEFYNGAPLASLLQSQSRTGANGIETSSIVLPKFEVVADPAAGYPHMVYGDGGRQVFIATPAIWGGVVPPRREVVAAGTGSDIGTQGGAGGTQNQEVKISKAASAV